MITAFNPNTCRFSTISKGDQGSWLTTPEEIVQRVNEATLPVYTKINDFYEQFQLVEKINSEVEQKIDTKRFCQALQPSLEELYEIPAVHVSDYLWPDGKMAPFNATLNKTVSKGFSFSVYFTLGEMVRPHSNYINFDIMREFAVIAPLKAIKERLLGIYTYDSCIYGSWDISSESSLVVPVGTDVPMVYKERGIKVVVYDPENSSLREAIKDEIVAQGRVYLKMRPHLLHIGSPAYLNGNSLVNVNTMNFFHSFLEAHPQVSFGHELVSLNGQKWWRYGFIRQYSFSEGDRSFMLIALKEMHEKIKDHMNELDLLKLEKYIESQGQLINLEKATGWFSDFTRNFTLDELINLKKEYGQFVSSEHSEIDDVEWVVARWLALGVKQGQVEGLEKVYIEKMQRLLDSGKMDDGYSLLSIILKDLEIESERNALALHILNLKVTREFNNKITQKYLQLMREGIKLKRYSFFDSDYSTDSVRSILEDYIPNIMRIESEMEKISNLREATEENEMWYLLKRLQIIEVETDPEELGNSYAKLKHARFYMNRDRVNKELYQTPIKDVESISGSFLTVWKKTYGAYELWKKFGLHKLYREKFPTDESFWSSDQTFVEIYRELKNSSTT